MIPDNTGRPAGDAMLGIRITVPLRPRIDWATWTCHPNSGQFLLIFDSGNHRFLRLRCDGPESFVDVPLLLSLHPTNADVASEIWY